MGKNKRVKKNLNVDRAKASSSMREPRKSDEETSGADGKKKQKKQPTATKEVSSNSLVKGQIGQEPGSQVKEASINDLPAEMLTEILKNVETQSLFACRLVNRQWGTISTQILPTRSDAVLEFCEANDGHYYLSNDPPRKKDKENSLLNFVESMKSSKNCPYARFDIESDDNESFFAGEDWIGFLSYFSPPNQIPNQKTGIKYLYLEIFGIYDVEMLTGHLRDLLLNKMPNLEEFGLRFAVEIEERPKIQLFPPSKSNTKAKNKYPETTTKALPLSIPAPIQLPHLNVLHFPDSLFEQLPLIVQDLVNAAVNLKSIRVYNYYYYYYDQVWYFNTFQILHSLGKLHLLQNAKIQVDQSFLDEVKTQPSDFTPAFKLHELKLHVVGGLEPTCCADAANFISLLLESSKDSLKKLEIEPLGFLGGLELPKFRNLWKLTLYQFREEPSFPPGTRSKDIFPAVSELYFEVVNYAVAFPREDSIPRLPNVKTLCLSDRQVSENFISVLALMCPNLKKFQIQKQKRDDQPPELDLLKIGRSIWTHMTQLESLEVDVNLDSPENNLHALDSCFTGFALEKCQRLFELLEAKKTFEKWGFQPNVPELASVSGLMGEREHSSILDMKVFKNLTVNPYSGTKLLDKKDFFAKKLRWISHDFAFKLMPNLKLNEN